MKPMSMTATWSLPSRGAWIEMISDYTRYDLEYVAPLAGSVDRNAERMEKQVKPWMSLPSRGAWIEINCGFKALYSNICRSPRGERG